MARVFALELNISGLTEWMSLCLRSVRRLLSVKAAQLYGGKDAGSLLNKHTCWWVLGKTKAIFVMREAQFRRLFLIFCWIKDKERWNLKGRRRGRAWSWLFSCPLPTFRPWAGPKLSSTLLGSLGFPISCPRLALASDVLEANILNVCHQIISPKTSLKYLASESVDYSQIFQEKGRFTIDRRGTVILTSLQRAFYSTLNCIFRLETSM